jgi:hypothetical protein
MVTAFVLFIFCGEGASFLPLLPADLGGDLSRGVLVGILSTGGAGGVGVGSHGWRLPYAIAVQMLVRREVSLK